MSRAALFVKHKAEPGLRDDVRRIWEKHVQPRVDANRAHEAIIFVMMTTIRMSSGSFNLTGIRTRWMHSYPASGTWSI